MTAFEEQLRQYLPADLPERERVAVLGARHLALIEETNRQFNLTRIVDPREAAIKHTVDSVMPWRHFTSYQTIADAGSGAGFPGIPLACLFPQTRFVLLESTGKKARFIETAARELGLENVTVLPERAEQWLRDNKPGLLTARAVAPVTKALQLFAPALGKSRILLFKGPDVESEIEELPPSKRRCVRVVDRYQLPESMGARTIIELLK